MNIQTYNVKLNMKDTGIVASGIRLKQGDSKMQFVFTIVDGGTNYFDSNDLPKVYFRRPDGTTVFGTSQISANNYIYQVVGNELEIAGNVLCDVKFLLIDGRESTSTFEFEVIPDTITANTEGAGIYDNDLADIVIAVNEQKNVSEQLLERATDLINEASQSVETASDSVILAESYTKGGTGARPGEDTDNAKYYYEHAQAVTGIGTGDLVIKQNGILAGTFNANSATDVEIDLAGGSAGEVAWGAIQGDLSDQDDLVETLGGISATIQSYVDDSASRGYYSPNVLNNTLSNMTSGGVSFTSDSNKGIVVNGTCTANSYVRVITSIHLEKGKYSFVKNTTSKVNPYLWDNTASENVFQASTNTRTDFEITDDTHEYQLLIYIANGTTYNETVYPMIVNQDISDDTYYPYLNSNSELSKLLEYKATTKTSKGLSLTGIKIGKIGIITFNGVSTDTIARTEVLANFSDIFTISTQIDGTCYNLSNDKVYMPFIQTNGNLSISGAVANFPIPTSAVMRGELVFIVN